MTAPTTSLKRTTAHVAGVDVTVLRGGHGPRLLVLHDEWGLGEPPAWAELGDCFELVIPVHPGFEDAPTLATIKNVGDLALLYLKLLESEGGQTVLCGASFGGWVALEMAVRCPHPISHLALISPLGLRFGGPEVRNFLDLYGHTEDELASLLYRDPERARRVTSESADDVLTSWVRNREATARYGWEPYLHTPGLESWSRHLNVPVLLVHGDEDRFVYEGYYDDVAEALPASATRVVERCGHFPLIEQGGAVARAIREFVAD